MLFRCSRPGLPRVRCQYRRSSSTRGIMRAGEKYGTLTVPGCTKVHSLSVGNRVYLKPARRNQVHVSVRTNHRNHATKKSNSKEHLTISRRHPGKHESVGLHSTLAQAIRDYLAGARRPRKAVSGKQGAVQGISAGRADYSESAALHAVTESSPHPISPEAGGKKITKRL